MINIAIFFASISLYILNQLILKHLNIIYLTNFFNFYFNDVLAQILMLSYSNFLMGKINKPILKLRYIILVVLACGIIWEFVAPLYKSRSTLDLFDFLAYLAGGLIYYIIISLWMGKNKLLKP